MEQGMEGQPEREPQIYYLAARFPNKRAAEKPYMEAQEAIKADCDLSAYRFLVPQQMTTPLPWYVVVIGERPPDVLEQLWHRSLGRERCR
jgi:hypothetical protein